MRGRVSGQQASGTALGLPAPRSGAAAGGGHHGHVSAAGAKRRPSLRTQCFSEASGSGSGESGVSFRETGQTCVISISTCRGLGGCDGPISRPAPHIHPVLQLVPLHQHKLTVGSSGHQEVPEEASWDGESVQGPSGLKSPPAQTVRMSKLRARLASPYWDANRSLNGTAEAMISSGRPLRTDAPRQGAWSRHRSCQARRAEHPSRRLCHNTRATQTLNPYSHA